MLSEQDRIDLNNLVNKHTVYNNHYYKIIDWFYSDDIYLTISRSAGSLFGVSYFTSDRRVIKLTELKQF